MILNSLKLKYAVISCYRISKILNLPKGVKNLACWAKEKPEDEQLTDYVAIYLCLIWPFVIFQWFVISSFIGFHEHF